VEIESRNDDLSREDGGQDRPAEIEANQAKVDVNLKDMTEETKSG
jgi:hypothetical protein